MEHIFESECEEDIRVVATRWQSDIVIDIHVRASNRMLLSFDMVIEDAEAMARAILGIPDVPFMDWDACVADMRAAAAMAALDDAREARSRIPA